MSAKKGTRPDVAASERAKEPGAACRQATNSIHNNITFISPEQAVKIADYLSVGADHAISLRDLASITDLPEREVRRQIEAARRTGTLIISDNRRGYWIADNPAEAQQFARSMQHRAREILRTAWAIKGAAVVGK